MPGPDVLKTAFDATINNVLCQGCTGSALVYTGLAALYSLGHRRNRHRFVEDLAHTMFYEFPVFAISFIGAGFNHLFNRDH